jgi:hypothetical protein
VLPNPNSLIFFLQDVILKLGAEKLQEMKESTVKTSEYFDWELTDEETEFFRKKMEDYCQECDGISLMELLEEYNESEED